MVSQHLILDDVRIREHVQLEYRPV
jgi:hypothetical protein